MPKPRGYDRRRLLEAYHDSNNGKTSDPINPKQLEEVKENFSLEQYNWIYLTVWLGLRPLEADPAPLRGTAKNYRDHPLGKIREAPREDDEEDLHPTNHVVRRPEGLCGSNAVEESNLREHQPVDGAFDDPANLDQLQEQASCPLSESKGRLTPSRILLSPCLRLAKVSFIRHNRFCAPYPQAMRT